MQLTRDSVLNFRRPLAWFRRRGALLLLAVALAFVALNARRFVGNDFAVYYRAGKRFLAGADLYAVGYRYQPATAAIFAPLSLLPYQTAKATWAALTVLMALGVAAWLHCRLGSRRWFAAPLAWLCLFHPLAQELQLGQVHVFVLAALVAAFALEDHSREWSAGALIALAAALKVAPILLLGDAFLRRRWRVVGGFFLGLAVLASASALRYGLAGAAAEHVAWLQSQWTLTAALLDSDINQSVFAILRSWGGGSAGGLAAALALALVALSARHVELRRALCLAVMVLITPNGWVQGFVLAAPLTALLIAGPAPAAWGGFVLALGTGLLGYDVLGPAGEAWTQSHRILGLDLLALFLFGRFAGPWAVSRAPRAVTGPSSARAPALSRRVWATPRSPPSQKACEDSPGTWRPF